MLPRRGDASFSWILLGLQYVVRAQTHRCHVTCILSQYYEYIVRAADASQSQVHLG
jgi:hypothetical protein